VVPKLQVPIANFQPGITKQSKLDPYNLSSLNMDHHSKRHRQNFQTLTALNKRPWNGLVIIASYPGPPSHCLPKSPANNAPSQPSSFPLFSSSIPQKPIT
jgi:hypothetical protein